MLLATIALLPAAFGRLSALVGGGLLLMTIATDSFLVAGIAHDFLTRGRIHRAYLWGGAFMLAIHFLRLPAGNSKGWLAIADLLLRPM